MRPSALPPLDFAARLDAPELLDSGAGTPQDVAANLGEMARLNRCLGGYRALTRHLNPLLAQTAATPTLLDLGTGSAHLLVEIQRRLQRQGRQAHLLGVDFSARNLLAARLCRQSSTCSLVIADARCLPVPDQSVDFVISTLFLHHFSPAQASTILAAAFAKARHGILMSDLVRGWLPYLAFKLVQPVFARHPFTRYDGALSIRRAYTPAELLALAQHAGLPQARVYTHRPWRMTLVALKEPGGPA